MKNVLWALVVLILVGVGTYYYIFNGQDDLEYGLDKSGYTESSVDDQGTVSNANAESPKEEVVVYIKNFAFNAPAVSVRAGTKVTWINEDKVAHSVVSTGTDILKSALLEKGESFSFVFNDAGVVDYYCGPHPSMKGKIVVTN